MRSHTLGFYLGFAFLASAAHGWENYCNERGIFPHPKDCTSFITCHGPEKSEYKMATHRCPSGQAFSESDLRCTSLDEIPECEQEVNNLYNPYASDPACSGVPVHCANCSHLVFCQLVGNEYQNPQFENCAFSGSSTPFCDPQSVTCSSLLPAGCDRPGFVCTSPGHFPDPNQCDIYHVCYNTTLYDSYRCADPSKPEYRSEEFRCAAINGTGCAPAVCNGILGVISYPSDPRYYVLCMSGGKNEIYSCPGNTEFISASEGCRFECRKAGLFPNHLDCTQFYRCDATDDVEFFEKTLEDCPVGLAFNPVSLSCDEKTNVKC